MMLPIDDTAGRFPMGPFLGCPVWQELDTKRVKLPVEPGSYPRVHDNPSNKDLEPRPSNQDRPRKRDA